MSHSSESSAIEHEVFFSKALRDALRDELTRDGNVTVMGEDIGVYGGAFGITRGLLEEFGEQRIIDTPISELGFVGLSVGNALMGGRPVVEIMFMDFVALALDQMVNQAAKLRYVYGEQASCPMVLRLVGGGGKSYGPTHSQCLEAWFMHTPGLKVVAPATVEDAYGLMVSAIRDDNPVVFLEHKLLYPQKAIVPTYPEPIEIGEARVAREGDDITVLAYAYMVVEAMKAAEAMAKHDVSVEVIDLRSLAPLDEDAILASVEKTGRAVVVAEDCRTAGVSAEIVSVVMEGAFDFLDAPVKRLTAPDIPISASATLEEAALPRWQDIAKSIHETMHYGT